MPTCDNSFFDKIWSFTKASKYSAEIVFGKFNAKREFEGFVSHEVANHVKFLNPQTSFYKEFIWDDDTVSSNLVTENTKHTVIKQYYSYDRNMCISDIKKQPFTTKNKTLLYEKEVYVYTLEGCTLLVKYTNNSMKFEVSVILEKTIEKEFLWNLIASVQRDGLFVVSNNEFNAIMKEYYKLNNAFYFIGFKPRNIKRGDLPALKDYCVSLKIDGIRGTVMITRLGDVFIIDTNFNFIVKTGMRCPEYTNTLIDSEVIWWPQNQEDKIERTMVLLDIMCFKGLDLKMNKNFLFDKRISLLDEISKKLKPSFHTNFIVNRYFKDIPFGINDALCEIKPFNYYPSDGYIFTPTNQPYPKKKGDVLKWKNGCDNTIDFYSVKQENGKWLLYVMHLYNKVVGPQKVLFDDKIIPDTKGFITHETFFDNEDDIFTTNTVIEYRWDFEVNRFLPIKTRHDKTVDPMKHGNFSVVAINVWEDIHDQVSLEDILSA